MKNHEKFYQQRRNLILSSIGLSIYDIIGLKIDVINVLGNQVSITNQQSFEVLFIVFWAYSLIRFFQYSSIEESFGHKKLFSDYREFLKNFRHKYIFGKIIDVKNTYSDGMGGKEPFKYEDIKKQGSFKWVYTYKPYDPLNDKVINEDGVTIYFNILEMVKPYIATYLKLLMLRPAFTEYILPYLLAIATMVILVFF